MVGYDLNDGSMFNYLGQGGGRPDGRAGECAGGRLTTTNVRG
jgi:hypothetical protein